MLVGSVVQPVGAMIIVDDQRARTMIQMGHATKVNQETGCSAFVEHIRGPVNNEPEPPAEKPKRNKKR